MTIEEAKQIKLQDYLHSLGFSPVKQQGDNLWYKSPFRDESEASFKVNTVNGNDKCTDFGNRECSDFGNSNAPISVTTIHNFR